MDSVINVFCFGVIGLIYKSLNLSVLGGKNKMLDSTSLLSEIVPVVSLLVPFVTRGT